MQKFECERCRKYVERKNYTLKNKRKFCSRLCADMFRRGKKQSKEVIENRVLKLIGQKRSDAYKQRMSFMRLGDKNPAWNFINPHIKTIHRRFRNKYGKAVLCGHCGSTVNVEWSNKNHAYDFVRKDWRQLCRSCHNKYDYDKNKRTKPYSKKG